MPAPPTAVECTLHALRVAAALAGYSISMPTLAQNAAERWAPSQIATDRYESSPTFTPDGRELYFMRSDRQFRNWRILWSRCDNGAWTSPRPAPFAATPPAADADPFVAPDGKRVYFVSDRHNPGGDDLDIWFADRTADGRWGTPHRLPAPVNSTASELLPRLSSDGYLYFGSSREGGPGQGDIYRARQDNGHWRVELVGPPVSTAANDYEADISRDGRTLILVSDRGDRSHLYRYALRDGRWTEMGRIGANPQVFQVGPLLSPRGDRLLFAQADGDRSGEFYTVDLSADADRSWPPNCARTGGRSAR